MAECRYIKWIIIWKLLVNKLDDFSLHILHLIYRITTALLILLITPSTSCISLRIHQCILRWCCHCIKQVIRRLNIGSVVLLLALNLASAPVCDNSVLLCSIKLTPFIVYVDSPGSIVVAYRLTLTKEYSMENLAIVMRDYIEGHSGMLGGFAVSPDSVLFSGK